MTEEVKPIKQIAVRVIDSRGKGAVVEWVEDRRAFRKIVPLSKIKNGEIPKDVLDKAPNYGIPWAKELKIKANSEDVEIALHNAGIWTAEDALRNPQGIIGAFNAAYKSGLAEVLETAKTYNKKE